MKEKIIEVINNTLGVNNGIINEKTVIADVPEWDSMMFLMILSELEEQLGISIPIDEAINIENVSEIFKYAEV